MSYLAALAAFVVKETVKAECVLERGLTAAAVTTAECPEREKRNRC